MGSLAFPPLRPPSSGRDNRVTMRILLVEDERGIADFISRGLGEAGYAMDVAEDGASGLDAALDVDFDLVVLDLMLPGMDGIAVLRKLRERRRRFPILLLTARDAIEDRVRGLDSGADDYLVKPFAFPELLARVRALLRRPTERVEPVYAFGGLELDTARREVRRGGAPLDLTAREYAILEYLFRNEGRTLTREQIEEHVWNFASSPGSNVVDVYIGYIRRKIDAPGFPSVIRTMRGIGYRVEDSGAGL